MKKKKYFIATGVIVIIFIIASLLLGGQTDQPETSKVRPGSIKKTVEETGTVFSKRVNTFYSDMSQRVETLNVSVGDRVKKGDRILLESFIPDTAVSYTHLILTNSPLYGIINVSQRLTTI